VQVGADRQGVVWIDGGVALFDVLDDAVFVYDDVGPLRPLVGVALNIVALEDAVGGQHPLIHIAQKRELDVDLLGEGGIGRGGIHADAKNFRIGGINFAAVDSRLDRLELLRSTTGESEDVNGKEDVFLALVVAELDRLPLVAQQGEIRSGISHFERNLRDFFLLRGGGKKG
jgi:hypothetical protein